MYKVNRNIKRKPKPKPQQKPQQEPQRRREVDGSKSREEAKWLGETNSFCRDPAHGSGVICVQEAALIPRTRSLHGWIQRMKHLTMATQKKRRNQDRDNRRKPTRGSSLPMRGCSVNVPCSPSDMTCGSRSVPGRKTASTKQNADRQPRRLQPKCRPWVK